MHKEREHEIESRVGSDKAELISPHRGNEMNTTPTVQLPEPTMHSVKSRSADPRSRFYAWQLVSFLLYWLLFRARTGRPFYASAVGSVCTRPQWMPRRVLLFLHRFRVPTFVCMPALLAIASMKSDSLFVRLITAIATSLYHLLESSVTTRHGEYPLLYNVWGMVLPERYAHAISFGTAIHFVLSAGVAKLQVGGVSWMHPDTMSTYLDIYRNSRSNPPLSPSLSKLAVQSAWATGAMGIGTIALECFLMPATLVLESPWRNIGSVSMIALHVGIATVMSGQVGLAFLTTLPSYLLGFSCPAALGSKPWWAAATVALLPTAYTMLTGLSLKENWPSTPVSLFMWSGKHANALRHSLMIGDTRVVMSTAEAPVDITGLQVLPNGFPVDGLQLQGASVVHDVLTRVIGFTLAQGDLVDGALAIQKVQSGEAWNVSPFLHALQAWLIRDRRMIEMHSGQPLVRAALVCVDPHGRVGKVLSD